MKLKSKVCIILLGLVILSPICLFSFYYINNGGNNIKIGVVNTSSHDSTYVEMYWDDELIKADTICKKDWYYWMSFNTSWGNHTLKLIANGEVEESNYFVFPMKFFLIDYYGKDFYEWGKRDDAFFITTGIMPINIE